MTTHRRLTWMSVLAAVAMLTAVGPTAMAAHTGATAGRVFYVSPQGDDSNTGTSRQHPFRHIQRCADVMEPGDICLVMDGVYRETVRPAHSGTADQPITYRPISTRKQQSAGPTRLAAGARPR